MSGLRVLVPRGRWLPEKKYVAEYVFRETLGLSCEILVGDTRDWEIRCGERTFSLPNLFFPEDDPGKYLMVDSLPGLPLKKVALREIGLPPDVLMFDDIPVLYGKEPCRSIGDIDLLGGIFFMLSRYEEVAVSERDALGRFPAAASIAYRAGFLHRPIVDEYVELIWYGLKETAPSLERRKHVFRVVLSHDVDVPTRWHRHTVGALARAVARDAVTGKSVREIVTTVRSYFDLSRDPYFCYDWIMSLSERFGLKSCFFFLAGATHSLDVSYDLRDELYRNLIREIDRRGHEIGFHGSYRSYNSPEITERELNLLRDVSPQPVKGGRQHCLMFRVPVTWRILSEAGLEYDSTLGYADSPGFRCGTAREFPVFDVCGSRRLDIRERPLIVMEQSLLDPGYLGLDHEEAFERVRELVDVVGRYGGDFTLLWHNHNLLTGNERALYSRVLEYVCSRKGSSGISNEPT